MTFTKDRISSIVLSMIITAGVFAPWWWATWAAYGLTWVSTGFFSAYSFLASIIVLQNSKKTVIYAAAVANSRSDKSFGIFGTLLTAAPIVLISVSWIVTSNLVIGALFPLSWLAFWIVTNKAEDLFYKLPEENQNELIRLIRKKISS
jgi:hypothetical protein